MKVVSIILVFLLCCIAKSYIVFNKTQQIQKDFLESLEKMNFTQEQKLEAIKSWSISVK